MTNILRLNMYKKLKPNFEVKDSLCYSYLFEFAKTTNENKL